MNCCSSRLVRTASETVEELADYYRLSNTDSRRVLAELAAEGQLEVVNVKDWPEPVYLHPEAKSPRSVSCRALLCPFDPVVWNRDRAERLFNFHYRIEIYTPEAKRKYGYYVLPFLLDEAIAGPR